ncbi:MAG: hypothetical protein HZA24_04265 [Nitrospirae bacterium]|nr:hypothetical protein [Nitrospirota bacterium]
MGAPRAVLLLAALLALCAPAWAAPTAPTAVPPEVAVYVKVDELAVLWGFRDKDTGAYPQPGDPRYEEYRLRWQTLVHEVFRQIRLRVPRHITIRPATQGDPAGLHVDVTVADMSTTCAGHDYYKYLWVRTYQDDGITTNWDGLGVRSDTVVERSMDAPQRVKADLDAWVQIWGQVPYLRVTRDATPARPAPAPANGAEAPAP